MLSLLRKGCLLLFSTDCHSTKSCCFILKAPLDLITSYLGRSTVWDPSQVSARCDQKQLAELQRQLLLHAKCEMTSYFYDSKYHIFISVNNVFLRYLADSATVLIVVLGLCEVPCFSWYSRGLKQGICI